MNVNIFGSKKYKNVFFFILKCSDEISNSKVNEETKLKFIKP